MTTAAETFTNEDLRQFAERGITPEYAARQIDLLRNPPPAIVLDRPCTIGDGITRIPVEAEPALIQRGDIAAAAGRVTKFVPASGAATRMFKELIAALQDTRGLDRTPAAREFFERLDSFPFAEELRQRTDIPGDPESPEEQRALLRALVEEMAYAQKPKGLVLFHRGVERARTAFEEQLLEAARFARADDGTVRAHFTVAPEFRGEFEMTLADITPEILKRRRGCTLDVSFSEQHPATDTLALDASGDPFRLRDGSLLFRPGGHGALLRNLGQLDADIVSIKNIDNILPDESSSEAVRWKRILIGYLIALQHELVDVLAACDPENAPEAALDRAVAFAAFRFARQPEGPLLDRDEKRRFVFDALERPLRVCGVVRNEGEPGGAPFWVRGTDGSYSVQIVESSQVDAGDHTQVRVFKTSTHFNPVDIVCSLRSRTGEPFALERFVDHSAIFLSDKSFEGRDLRALEQPGLWNGAMAQWNTVCVEVPASTFAPVKTVFDLLRPQHQQRPAATSVPSEDVQPEGQILVIEDNPTTRRALLQILSSAALQTALVSDGERGLQLAREQKPDLILLELNLPGLDGLDVLTRLRADDETRDIPVVLISSAAGDDRVRGLQLGAADSISAPFTTREVLARVNAQLRIAQLTKSLSAANRELVEQQVIMADGLRAAADIQKGLLPTSATHVRRLELGTLFQPSLDLGGDTFNIVSVADRFAVAFIADISGHGIASSLFAVSLTQRMDAAALLLGTGGVSPADILRALDQEYPFERFGKYVAMSVAVIDLDSGAVRYSSAGHPPPFIVRADGAATRLENGGPVLGMGFGLAFEDGEASLGTRDRLVMYTDGVIAEESSSGERFGLDALIETFRQERETPVADVCEGLREQLIVRRGDTPPGDDDALLAIEYRGTIDE